MESAAAEVCRDPSLQLEFPDRHQEEELRRTNFTHRVRIQVRWSDMDSLGHVNNSRFFTYMEMGRIHYITSCGIWKPDQRSERGPILARAACDFRRQVRYPGELEVFTRLLKIGNSSITLEQGVFETGVEGPVAEGSSVLVWVDYQTGKSVPLSAGFREMLVAFEEERVFEDPGEGV